MYHWAPNDDGVQLQSSCGSASQPKRKERKRKNKERGKIRGEKRRVSIIEDRIKTNRRRG